MTTPSSMEFTIEPAGPCRKRVTVKISQERVTEEFDKSYRNFNKSVPIPGFRQGKAPRKLVEKRYGEQVTVEVRQALLDAAFTEALEQNKLAPITDPELDVDAVEVKPATPLGFEFTITVKPEFDLPDLKGIEVSVPEAKPNETQIEAALLSLRKRKATLRPVTKGKVEEGDVITLRVVGKAGPEGKQEEAFSEESLSYEVGSRHFGGLVTTDLDGAILGKKAGDNVSATAFVPAHAEGHPLQGLELTIEAELLDLKRPDIPALDDALAQSLDYENTEAMRESVTQEITARLERDRERAIEDRALDQLIEQTSFELPEELIKKELEDASRRAAYEMQMAGKGEEEIAQRITEIRARRTEESTREMKSYFVLDKLVEKERILVTETEVRNAVGMIGAYNGKTPEQMYATLRESGRLGSLRNQLRENKARARLRSKVKVLGSPGPSAPGASEKTASRKGGSKKKES